MTIFIFRWIFYFKKPSPSSGQGKHSSIVKMLKILNKTKKNKKKNSRGFPWCDIIQSFRPLGHEVYGNSIFHYGNSIARFKPIKRLDPYNTIQGPYTARQNFEQSYFVQYFEHAQNARRKIQFLSCVLKKAQKINLRQIYCIVQDYKYILRNNFNYTRRTKVTMQSL